MFYKFHSSHIISRPFKSKVFNSKEIIKYYNAKRYNERLYSSVLMLTTSITIHILNSFLMTLFFFC